MRKSLNTTIGQRKPSQFSRPVKYSNGNRYHRKIIFQQCNLFLYNDLPNPECMKLHLHIIPQEIIDEYALHDLVDKDVWIYLKIVKGMYGLKQAGIIANMELTNHVQHTTVLWRHKTRATIFTLVVDNFATKYMKKQDTDHLLQSLRAKYTIYTDWEASLYIGILINWDYTTVYVDLSMPKYVAKALHKFKQSLHKFHPNNKPEYSPHKHVDPNYG